MTEGGGPGAAVGWSTSASGRRTRAGGVHAMRCRAGEGGVADPWARGHSNRRRGQNSLNRFKISNSLKMFNFFQTLIDPNLTFPSSKILNKI
jgi:hypothetical protein